MALISPRIVSLSPYGDRRPIRFGIEMSDLNPDDRVLVFEDGAACPGCGEPLEMCGATDRTLDGLVLRCDRCGWKASAAEVCGEPDCYRPRPCGDHEAAAESPTPAMSDPVRYAEGVCQPFCACGRRISECDGSRAGCRKGGPT